MTIPPPTILARPIALEDCPGGAKAIWRKAEKEGWEVKASYAKGPWLHAGGERFRVLESVGLRMYHRGTARGAVAIWITDAKGKFGFESAWWRDYASRIPWYRINNVALRASLTSKTEPPKIESPTEGDT
jgi:hypothetical protein